MRTRTSAKAFARPYDWTFTSSYCGSLSPGLDAAPTDVGIDYELLKQPEKILMHDLVYLYAVRAGPLSSWARAGPRSPSLVIRCPWRRQDDFGDNGTGAMFVRLVRCNAAGARALRGGALVCLPASA